MIPVAKGVGVFPLYIILNFASSARTSTRQLMPKKPPKNYDLDEDQYTRSFNKADDSPTSWVCRDADCAYENEAMEDEECEACGEARYEELVDCELLFIKPIH